MSQNPPEQDLSDESQSSQETTRSDSSRESKDYPPVTTKTFENAIDYLWETVRGHTEKIRKLEKWVKVANETQGGFGDRLYDVRENVAELEKKMFNDGDTG